MKRMILSREEIIRSAKSNDKTVTDIDKRTEDELRQWFSKNRYLDREYFLKLCNWKSKRPKKHYESEINSEQRIKYITGLSISSNDEYFKVESLQLLRGVSYPVASVILHFAHPDDYTILDFRAIWSLGWKQPKSYDFDFWLKYTEHVKNIAKKNRIDLRTLDKALWYYSKVNQEST